MAILLSVRTKCGSFLFWLFLLTFYLLFIFFSSADFRFLDILFCDSLYLWLVLFSFSHHYFTVNTFINLINMHNIFIEWLLFGLMRKKCVCFFFSFALETIHLNFCFAYKLILIFVPPIHLKFNKLFFCFWLLLYLFRSFWYTEWSLRWVYDGQWISGIWKADKNRCDLWMELFVLEKYSRHLCLRIEMVIFTLNSI